LRDTIRAISDHADKNDNADADKINNAKAKK
jgi:hypothetical protein